MKTIRFVRMEKMTAPWTTLFVLSLVLQAHCQADGITFSLRGVPYSLHDLVTMEDVLSGSNGLIANTIYRPCCLSIGNWFIPGDTSPLGMESTLTFYQSRNANGQLILNRRDFTSTGVLYTCSIPNSSGELTNVYIGLYPADEGAPEVTDLTYNSGSRTLTCASVGGPATTVIWRRNCSPITGTTTQEVLDTSTASYQSRLTLSQEQDGVYSCTVENRRGRSSMNVTVGATPVDVAIVSSEAMPTAGQPLTLTCSVNAPSAVYQWLDRHGNVLNNSSQTLMFEVLRETDREFYCVVTMGTDVSCAEYYRDVQVPTLTVSLGDVTGIAESPVTLSCDLSQSIPSAMYSFYRDGVLLSGPTTTSTYTISKPRLGDAGNDYSCGADITLDFLDLSSPLTVSSNTATLTLTIKEFSTLVVNRIGDFTTGNSGTIQCLVTSGLIGEAIDGALTLFRVTGSGDTEVISSSRITVSDTVELAPNAVFNRDYLHSPLSRIRDSGMYYCRGTISPEIPSQFIMNAVGTSSLVNIDVVDPTLDIQVTMVTGRVLDISPYNTFTLTCTATSSIVPTKSIQWTVSVNGGSPSSVTSGVVNSDLTQATSTSELSVTTTAAGQFTYSCEAALELGAIPDSVQDNRQSVVNVQGPALPSPPTALSVIRVDHQSASLGWTVGSVAYDDETYVVMFGRVSNDLQSSSAEVEGSNDIELTNQMYSVEIDGLEPETMYYYLVRASNNQGTTPSVIVSFNTTGIGPSAPLSLSYTQTTPTMYTFQWLPPNDTDVSVDMYQLICQATLRPGETLRNLVMDTMATNVTSDLVAWANYSCFVVASNVGGTSPPSNQLTFITPEIAPTGAPQQFFSLVNPIRGMITFRWSIPPLTQRNGEIIEYLLFCVAGSHTVTNNFTPADQYTMTGFIALTQYTCTVRAVNSAGEGPPATVNVTSGEDAPGVPPLDFTYLAESAMRVLFIWSPPPADQHNGQLTDYIITCTNEEGLSLSQDYPSGFINGSIETFSPATRYMCGLQASTAAGIGPAANISILTLPSAPNEVMAKVLSSRSINVTWLAPSGVVTEHVVYVNGTEAGRTQGSEFIVMSLRPYTVYTVDVSAVNEAGEGVTSDAMNIRTLEDLPGPVNCVSRFRSSNTTSVTVAWQPPAEENGVILYYHLVLYRYTSRSPVLAEANVTSAQLDFTLTPSEHLLDGIPYNVDVLAGNSVGLSTEPCVTTDFNVQLAPPTPSNVMAVRSSPGDTIMVTWDVPTLIEAQGYVNYTVTFAPSRASRRRRQTSTECSVSPCIVPVEEGGVDIVGLNRGTNLDLSVTPANEDGLTGESISVTSPGVSSPRVAIIAGAAGAAGASAVIILLIVLIIVLLCCLHRKGHKGQFDPETDFYEEYAMTGKHMYAATNPVSPPSSSSGTTSPRREFMSPLHMSTKDFMEPVDLIDFKEYVAHMHQNKNKGFERAFDSLPGPNQGSCEVAGRNKEKNRFQIHPYDITRVKLTEIPGDPDSDYINASFIDVSGYKKPRMYIAAQGPMGRTVDDFWRMIWQYRLQQIVMLTKTKEGGKEKCKQYWPGEVNSEYLTPSSSLCIVCTEVTQYADYLIRKFFVTDTSQPEGQGLAVTQYHFIAWPDHGVPEYATSLIGFIRRVRSTYDPKGPPLLVHCNEGVGRTGTFIVLDTMLDRIKEQPTVNVYETLTEMRMKRPKMVQNKDQFVFIHDALNELIVCGDTEIPANDMANRVKALHRIRPGGQHESEFNYQFQLLNEVSPQQSQLNEALQHYNQHKNRYQDKTPNSNSKSCVYLKPITGIAGGEYINASFVNGYKQHRAYIATQAPLDTTIEDFWRMVWEQECTTIVMLCDLMEDKKDTAHRYWPEGLDSTVRCGQLWVTTVTEDRLDDGLTVRRFTVSDEQDVSPGDKVLTVHQFHYTEWPEHDRPISTDQVQRILDEVTEVQRATKNKPIVVMCNDGMGRTGAFICIHSQWERIKTEQMADLFQFVKSARHYRSNLILELEHYIFCHDTLADKVQTFEVSQYANFQ